MNGCMHACMHVFIHSFATICEKKAQAAKSTFVDTHREAQLQPVGKERLPDELKECLPAWQRSSTIKLRRLFRSRLTKIFLNLSINRFTCFNASNNYLIRFVHESDTCKIVISLYYNC